MSAQPTTFVSVRDTQLVLNECAFDYTGANCYYLLDLQARPWSWEHGPQQVNAVLDYARDNCLTVIRAHAFLDGEAWPGQPGLQFQPNQYDSTYLLALDSVIYKAGVRGLKLIMPLVNYWEDYGGMLQYVDWYNEMYDPNLPRTRQQFYTNDSLRSWFRNYIHDVVTRVNSVSGISYDDDPTILAWELGNEPRPNPTWDEASLFAWIDEMASWLRVHDQNHLVGIGAEGNYGGNADTSYFRRMHDRTSIDFCTQHLYPDCGHQCITTLPDVLDFVHDRIRLSYGTLNKPILFDEFGFSRDYLDDNGIGRIRYFSELLDQFNADHCSGSNFWILFPGEEGYWPGWNWDGIGVFEIDDAVALDSITIRACHLEAPEVTIRVQNNTILLDWCSTPGAFSYEVQATSTPDGLFQTVAEPCSTSWSTSISAVMRFYRVVATR